jgi:hypothetical protein
MNYFYSLQITSQSPLYCISNVSRAFCLDWSKVELYLVVTACAKWPKKEKKKIRETSETSEKYNIGCSHRLYIGENQLERLLLQFLRPSHKFRFKLRWSVSQRLIFCATFHCNCLLLVLTLLKALSFIIFHQFSMLACLLQNVLAKLDLLSLEWQTEYFGQIGLQSFLVVLPLWCATYPTPTLRICSAEWYAQLTLLRINHI